MRLIKLTIKNFKGIRDFELVPNSQNLSIFGDNAAGKTTLADAWFWLLFGKDSENQADFEIKTIDPATGEPIHNLKHSVHAVLDLDGSELELKREYFEVYTSKRGSAVKEFTRHTTDYFVNTVPVDKSEYDRRVSEICDEKLFRLLTDPICFCKVLPWQERRKLLVNVSGDVSDADVIASDSKLSPLADILAKHSVDDFKKILASKRKEINERLKSLPAMINENNRLLGEGLIFDAEELTLKRDELKALTEKKARIQAGGEAAEKTKELRLIESAMLEIEHGLKSEASKDFSVHQQRLRDAESALNVQQRELDRCTSATAAHVADVARLSKQREDLLALYRQIDAEEFLFTGKTECAACGQSLPESKVEEARAKALGNFNQEKSRRLEANRAEGLQLKSRIQSLEAVISENELDQSKTEAEIVNAQEALQLIQSESSKIERGEIDLNSNTDWQAKQSEKNELLKQIETLKESSGSELANVSTAIASAQTEIERLETAKAAVTQQDVARKRIEELEAEEKDLARAAEKVERDQFLVEEFVREKVRMLTVKINSKFSRARFKLFEDQMNGGLAEICEVMNERGVVYSSTNNADRVNLGLDIINTLAEHNCFAPPIFIDGAESVTDIIPTLGQQIRLIVSAGDTKLRTQEIKTKETVLAS